ncbi:MAG: DUF2252 domain-containing protein [Alphaproteobacteria bacterium]|nr:DUF2252 domain-containing protein [Alphaproteobacteria bacterium]
MPDAAPLPNLMPRAARREAGRAARRCLPRRALATLAGRARDPVALLQAADTARIPALLPLRYARMRRDPFAFLRGSAALMAADLAAGPNTGLVAQACGDCHLLNFGTYASPEGTPLFDINDFDETLPAPFEWDVKRLAASVAVAARARGERERAATAFARQAAEAYRHHMLALAAMPLLDGWRDRIDLAGAVAAIDRKRLRLLEQRRLRAALAASRSAYANLVAKDGLRLPEHPPAIYRLGPEEATAHAAYAAYLDGLPEERRALLARYRLRDIAFKAVGVGSVGTFCAIGLFATADGEPLLLQLKEAQGSVLAPYAGASAYAHHGQRVVVGQRIMQAATDILLNWTQGGPEGRHFYVRALKDSRLAAIGAQIEDAALAFYAPLCGRTLARAHARAGDAAAIAGYLGNGTGFEDAIAEFALAYARLTEADHAAFCAAIEVGRIEAAA